VTRGVLDETVDAHLLAAARHEVLAALEDGGAGGDGAGSGPARTDAELAEGARQAVRRSLGRVLGFKPVTTASVLRLRR